MFPFVGASGHPATYLHVCLDMSASGHNFPSIAECISGCLFLGVSRCIRRCVSSWACLVHQQSQLFQSVWVHQGIGLSLPVGVWYFPMSGEISFH